MKLWVGSKKGSRESNRNTSKGMIYYYGPGEKVILLLKVIIQENFPEIKKRPVSTYTLKTHNQLRDIVYFNY